MERFVDCQVHQFPMNIGIVIKKLAIVVWTSLGLNLEGTIKPNDSKHLLDAYAVILKYSLNYKDLLEFPSKMDDLVSFWKFVLLRDVVDRDKLKTIINHNLYETTLLSKDEVEKKVLDFVEPRGVLLNVQFVEDKQVGVYQIKRTVDHQLRQNYYSDSNKLSAVTGTS